MPGFFISIDGCPLPKFMDLACSRLRDAFARVMERPQSLSEVNNIHPVYSTRKRERLIADTIYISG